jgi:hypothetical protein
VAARTADVRTVGGRRRAGGPVWAGPIQGLVQPRVSDPERSPGLSRSQVVEASCVQQGPLLWDTRNTRNRGALAFGAGTVQVRR